MPIDLREAHGDLETILLSYGGESVTISFYPNQQTVGWAMELEHAMQVQDYEQMSALLAETIESWDVYDNGELLPIDADSMMRLPLSLMALMATQMSERANARGRAAHRPRNPARDLFEDIFGREPRQPRDETKNEKGE